ncbi:mannose-6-phosphate isomerase-like protein (cupin superfamily) [Deinococcus metalli]|uniref:Mannose-6-phosphate isomerase n=1 Tax=Deinococcus metalli TaxID=1141878 RepID=A0A7W8NT43_9DEIO|nr:cupin domain-containing protein [Deinococcus metalli]MBB5377812.1 mannose-6-phosphate isomerase-like protein (cupin superfamily) [Deinococcus metalli]GHF55759.1 mannose-6-phosphate isomerase [Deinococcus metalli]
MSVPDVLKLQEKFGAFEGYWQPKVIGELNGQHVKIAKISGEFVWHAHEHEDELFLVTRGTLLMRFRDGERRIGVGEMIIVPRGVEHLPVAEDEVWIVMFEPAGTLNTGNVVNERTVAQPEHL